MSLADFMLSTICTVKCGDICLNPTHKLLYGCSKHDYKNPKPFGKSILEPSCPCEEESRANCTECQDLPIWYFDKVDEPKYPFSNMSTDEKIDVDKLVKNLGRKLGVLQRENRKIKRLLSKRGRIIKTLNRKIKIIKWVVK